MLTAQARLWVRLSLLLAIGVAGCSRSGTVQGVVTYDNAEVKSGSIVFLPADGKGPSAGGKIIDGAYRVDRITRGKKRVQISAGPANVGSKIDPEDLKHGPPTEPPSLGQGGIPPNALGNNVEVEVTSDDQVLNFDLKNPVGASSR